MELILGLLFPTYSSWYIKTYADIFRFKTLFQERVICANTFRLQIVAQRIILVKGPRRIKHSISTELNLGERKRNQVWNYQDWWWEEEKQKEEMISENIITWDFV